MIERIQNLLRANGIKPSHHRIKVYQYLIENGTTPVWT